MIVLPDNWNDWGNKLVWSAWEDKVVGFVLNQNNFDTLSFAQQADYLKKLYVNNDFDQIKQLASTNKRLRIAFHEAAHVVVGKVVWNGKINFDSVSIGDQTTDEFVARKSVGESEWRVYWSSFFQFKNDKQFIYTQLAWYVLELWLWISHEKAFGHAGQDFHDICTWQLFEYIYDKWLKPIWFDDDGDVQTVSCAPPLTKEEIKRIIIEEICYNEIQPIAQILKNNRWLYCEIACELHKKWSLTQEKVNWLEWLIVS